VGLKSNQWLLLMHQIPPKPEALRVKIWRSLQKSGAIQLKNSVYVLPLSQANLSKFEAIVVEVIEKKGDAFLCQSTFIQGIEPREVVQRFNLDRNEKFQKLATEIRAVSRISDSALTEDTLMAVEHAAGRIERQLSELRAIDFFQATEGKSAAALFEKLSSRLADLRAGPRAVVRQNKTSFQKKIWVTRANVHTDRMACAWLIAKFIDEKARFSFTKNTNYRPAKNEIRYDMFDAEFTHVGDKCTFEVLVDSFGINDPAIRLLAEVIHDLDIQDTKFNHPETAGIGFILDGIANSETNDETRLERAFELFQDLYRNFSVQVSIISGRKSRASQRNPKPMKVGTK
jgi:CRISPR/Cas system-associated endoribonuclease Cas2